MSNFQAEDDGFVEDINDDMEDRNDDMEDRNNDMDWDDDILSGSDYDEYDFPNDKIPDTTAEQTRKGKDIQGIPWERLSITREKYRQTRLEQYKNYENVPNSGESSGKDCKVTRKGASFYEFRRNSRSVKSTILHFQLRNLVWATSKHDVYVVSRFQVMHYNTVTCASTEVLNVSGHVAPPPPEEDRETLLERLTRTRVSTLAVKDRFLVAGGFQGTVICKHLDRPGVSFCSRITHTDNAIINAVEIYFKSSGALHFTASNNDCGVRDFDMEKHQLVNHFRFPWPVNHTSLSPDGKLLTIVGDNPEGLLVDSNTGKTVGTLSGHLDYSFASAWHPDGHTFSTGNQDKTCRVWDIRNMSKSVAVLRANVGAIRSIRYSSDGKYMAVAEAADFVHVYDVRNGYETEQEIDFFGEVSGISFSPDTEGLFVGVWDRAYGSLLEYSRVHDYSHLDSFL
ncbi:PREDICTED: uncharacterized WD repeat-containing protein C2A9.03-like [Tarenaya hassleriana]|uniref:uncharacterized WD repeat-containing protein C2A9.03-like n=1 Tax=Tarenaya hassleriana TaxID=28532 RepID=UPI00053C5F23|nr:PREDICTED: uncharacterized WD repeat-containing protein C2A9.03-like [Tarenaya hassleriana]XP_010542489.1 PREDICTED: uncharacterized WD repeat-containing protein C2A9.03-like [Tarenaya hassleriana]XP_010542490.1 PREDICTED: uncharacterized WD repeat-containing protein C2A9.03-like [Tarenaya hassleriana]